MKIKRRCIQKTLDRARGAGEHMISIQQSVSCDEGEEEEQVQALVATAQSGDVSAEPA